MEEGNLLSKEVLENTHHKLVLVFVILTWSFTIQLCIIEYTFKIHDLLQT